MSNVSGGITKGFEESEKSTPLRKNVKPNKSDISHVANHTRNEFRFPFNQQ